jgi:hypothetical protein
MHYLYGLKSGVARMLVATFDSEPQLLAYVRWATLDQHELTFKFEKGSALASYTDWEAAHEPLTDDEPADVPHNPSPGML